VNPTLDKWIDSARFAPNDKVYKDSLQNMVNIVMTEMPRIPLYRKFADYAVQPNVKGFVYWFHTHPDFRTMYKD
jgi:peptide/nickel transport system substrate-binding protein